MSESSHPPVSPRFNRVLVGRSDDDDELLARSLDRVHLDQKAATIRASQPIEVVDLPRYAVASQLATTRIGDQHTVRPGVCRP